VGATRLVRSPDVLWRDLTDEVLLLGDGLTTPLAVVGPSADLWALLAEPRSVDELVAHLAARYQEEPATVRASVEATLESLEASGLIRRR
jgi:hypothetical protein